MEYFFFKKIKINFIYIIIKLWDVLEDQKAVDFVLENQHLTCSEISKKLLIKALDDGSTDNLSVIVVKI